MWSFVFLFNATSLPFGGQVPASPLANWVYCRLDVADQSIVRWLNFMHNAKNFITLQIQRELLFFTHPANALIFHMLPKH
ncbi:MAG TPA: hypothetical protein VMX97_02960 [Hyphomicrobiaceae bacterium]|nr:hypothetical protein [Hyphomicrobiaceae bacterium]